MWYSLILVVIVIGLSIWQKLHLEKDIVVGSVRAFLQLIAIGYILEFIFDLDKIYYTLLVIFIMSFVGALTSNARSKKLPGGLIIAWISIFVGGIVALGFLIAVTKEIDTSPKYLIPLAGIVIGNAVKAGSLSFERARAEINNNKNNAEIKQEETEEAEDGPEGNGTGVPGAGEYPFRAGEVVDDAVGSLELSGGDAVQTLADPSPEAGDPSDHGR